jgi:NADH-quinone oxidoreductase subunit A
VFLRSQTQRLFAFFLGAMHIYLQLPDLIDIEYPWRLTTVRFMESFLAGYLPILIFLGIAGLLTLVMVCLPLLAGPIHPDSEKLSSYECGFDTFGDARGQFDVRFYLVSILFIIFDLEVAFLFPWAVSLSHIGLLGFWSMMVFLFVLTVGFIYEWKKGALEWE